MQQGGKHNIKKNTNYYLTLTIVGWVDVFTRHSHKDAIIESLRYCIKNKGLNVYAYCLMTNHLHMVLNCNEPFQLKDVIRDFKRHTVKTIIDQIINKPVSRREWMLREFEAEQMKLTEIKRTNFGKVAIMQLNYSLKSLCGKR